MEKPHLVIFVKQRGIPIRGGCSSCKDVVFRIGLDIGSGDEHYSKLESLFLDHFRTVHMREDPSQAIYTN